MIESQVSFKVKMYKVKELSLVFKKLNFHVRSLNTNIPFLVSHIYPSCNFFPFQWTKYLASLFSSFYLVLKHSLFLKWWGKESVVILKCYLKKGRMGNSMLLPPFSSCVTAHRIINIATNFFFKLNLLE